LNTPHILRRSMRR
jgi:hypothetical protein